MSAAIALLYIEQQKHKPPALVPVPTWPKTPPGGRPPTGPTSPPPGALSAASGLVWPSVAEVFYAWNAQYEGAVLWMYADIKNYITTGVGNLIDPIDRALSLPWRHEDGTAASDDEIREAWYAVKDDPKSASKGHKYAEGLTDLRLTEGDVAELVDSMMQKNAAALAKRWPAFPSWPADAQLATLSMAWAMGSGFNFPTFSAAVAVQDFVTASQNCTIKEEGNPGVIPRNKANRELFLAAADVLASGSDPSVLTFDYSGLRRPDGAPPPLPRASSGTSKAVKVVMLAAVAAATFLAARNWKGR